MLTNQTHFQYLQRRDKERKYHILNNIEKKDLRRRSISYNFKSSTPNNHEDAQMDQKNDTKDHLSSITINNTIKKSYYYRKLMNKSIETHPTSEDVQRVKEKFDKVNHRQSQKDNKTMLFRQIWQKEQLRKQAGNQSKEEYNYLQVVSKNSQKYRTLSLEPDHLQKKKESPKNIFQIASERRTTLNFELQILGNKKSIRIKDKNNKMKINVIQNTKSITPQHQQKETVTKMSDTQKDTPQQKKEQQIKNKVTCTFFKRFQQQNSQAKASSNNQCLQITKLNQNMLSIGNNFELQSMKTKKIKWKQYQSQLNPNYITNLRRQIQSSWRPDTRTPMDKHKVETSHERRASILKEKLSTLPQFVNDIKGWVVQAQNEDYLLDNL